MQNLYDEGKARPWQSIRYNMPETQLDRDIMSYKKSSSVPYFIGTLAAIGLLYSVSVAKGAKQQTIEDLPKPSPIEHIIFDK